MLKKMVYLSLTLILIGATIAVPLNATAQQSGPIDISIIYAPESELYMPTLIQQFNASYSNGINPVTGQALSADEPIIRITGQNQSSGRMARLISSNIVAGNYDELPTIFQPSVTHWLEIVNFVTDQTIFDLSQTRATANAPVVIAIWESRLAALEQALGGPIGWTELIEVIRNSDDWCEEFNRTEPPCVYFGYTNPTISSTALSTLLTHYYILAGLDRQAGEALTNIQLNQSSVADQVTQIARFARRNAERTTEFKNYIALGPDYVDFVALEENDVIAINTTLNPPERLVAIYPPEGTFIHGHPMGILNGSWVSPAEQQAAQTFVDFVLLPASQATISAQGFRPVTEGVALDPIFNDANGVSRDVDLAALQLPLVAGNTLTQTQNSWVGFTKFQVLMVLDTSGSMENDDKLVRMQEGAILYLQGMQSTDSIGIMTFGGDIRTIIAPSSDVDTTRETAITEIQNLQPQGDTALFAAASEGIRITEGFETDGYRRVLLLLTDGENTETEVTLDKVISQIAATLDSEDPICIIPVFYETPSTDEDLIWQSDMQAIANAAGTELVLANPDNIIGILDNIDQNCED